MKREDLKSAFWGYQKLSVCQYITTLEEEFSSKLLEKEAEYQKILSQEHQKVQQLEEEVRTLRERCEAQQREQLLISDTLMEAQRYAELLKQETEKREQELQTQLKTAAAKQEHALQQYEAQVQQLREALRAMLQEMDHSAEEMSERIEHTKAAAPERNMLLFSRKKEPVA